jgi:transposase InsO family protein
MAASRVIVAARLAWWPTCSTGTSRRNRPTKVWVTDITYIHTYEGWLFLAAVIGLYSRQITAGRRP